VTSSPCSPARTLLARVWLFSELRPEQLDDLALLAFYRHVPQGAVVVRQGETDGDLYMVAKGLLRVSVRSSEGREVALGLLGSADVFGEVALVDGLARSATVTAQKPSELFVLPRRETLRFLEGAPEINAKLLVAMARHVRRLTRRVEELSALPVSTRMARRLVEIAEDHGTRVGPNRIALPVHLSQQDLADHVQATRESINKCFARWMRLGIVHRTHSQIVIDDVERLAALSAHQV